MVMSEDVSRPPKVNKGNTVTQHEMDAIMNALFAAKQYGLEVEVMWSAFQYIKENPDLSIIDAVEYGLEEWDI